MHPWKRICLTLLTVIGLVGAGALASPAASAEPVTYICIEEVPTLASGCFNSYGDHITVSDRKSDGWAARVYWKTDYGRKGYCKVPTGKDYKDCNYNFRENRVVKFRLELVKGSKVKKSHVYSMRA